MRPGGGREKGALGERQVLAILEQELGLKLVRNKQQAARGGRDIIEDVDRHQHPIPFAIEVKFRKTESIKTWWAQTVEQAEATGRKPVLFFRGNNKPWRVVADVHDINPEVWPVRRGDYVVLNLQPALQWMREGLK